MGDLVGLHRLLFLLFLLVAGSVGRKETDDLHPLRAWVGSMIGRPTNLAMEIERAGMSNLVFYAEDGGGWSFVFDPEVLPEEHCKEMVGVLEEHLYPGTINDITSIEIELARATIRHPMFYGLPGAGFVLIFDPTRAGNSTEKFESVCRALKEVLDGEVQDL